MKSNRLRHATQRVDAYDLLRCLHHIATHGGVGIAELRDLTGLSKPTLLRLVSAARKQYGVTVTYARNSVGLGVGEYTVEDWGVFDPDKVARYINEQKAR